MQLRPRERLPKVKGGDGFIDSGNQRYSTRIARELLDTTLDQFSSDPTGTPDRTLPKQGAVASPEEHVQDSESFEGAQNQLVIYSPGASDAGEIVPVPDPNEYQPPPHHSSTSYPSKVLPSIGAFAVQCAACFKWRLIPTKEKYEEIRENILQQLFTCERAQEWRPDISCDDPADISPDGNRLWAIDKPNIAQPPPGWERLLRIRGEGSTKFADVYYVAPSGKRLRSMVEVEKYLFEHPEYIRAGVNMSQFSFQIPKPLQENYVRKRTTTKMSRRYDGTALDMPREPLEPAEVNPLSWISPGENSDLPLPHGQGKSSTPYFEARFLQPRPRSVKKRATRRPSKQVYSSPV